MECFSPYDNKSSLCSESTSRHIPLALSVLCVLHYKHVFLIGILLLKGSQIKSNVSFPVSNININALVFTKMFSQPHKTLG